MCESMRMDTLRILFGQAAIQSDTIVLLLLLLLLLVVYLHCTYNTGATQAEDGAFHIPFLWFLLV